MSLDVVGGAPSTVTELHQERFGEVEEGDRRRRHQGRLTDIGGGELPARYALGSGCG